MEIEARLFKRQPQIFQKFPDFLFRIVQQLFVNDAVDIARCNRIKMRHRPHIIRIILAHMGKVITERLPLGEMLAIIGEAAIERVPPRIDDFGVGQNQTDERQIIPVIGQLIDEKWLVGFTLDARALDELCAKPFGIIGG